MNAIPVVLVREGPTFSVLIGVDRAECDAAARILSRWWGSADGGRKTPGGQVIEVGEADGIVRPYQVALIALDIHGAVLAIALADDRASASFLARDWAGEAAEVRILPADTVAAVLARGEGRSDPRILSTKFCGRCGDHPLYLDPIFDDLSRTDGSRICNACGVIEAMRLDRGSTRA